MPKRLNISFLMFFTCGNKKFIDIYCIDVFQIACVKYPDHRYAYGRGPMCGW